MYHSNHCTLSVVVFSYGVFMVCMKATVHHVVGRQFEMARHGMSRLVGLVLAVRRMERDRQRLVREAACLGLEWLRFSDRTGGAGSMNLRSGTNSWSSSTRVANPWSSSTRVANPWMTE